MQTITANTIPPLDPWGSVTGLGAQIIEGDVQVSGKMLSGTPEAPLSCAYFGCTKGKFRMTYPFNEHAVVVEGSVTLTDERSGKAQTYNVGDAWFVEKGTPVLWEVHTNRFVKNYLAAA